jgi:hypothetical protein
MRKYDIEFTDNVSVSSASNSYGPQTPVEEESGLKRELKPRHLAVSYLGQKQVLEGTMLIP